MTNIIKNKKKEPERKHPKDIKIFLQKKKTKVGKRSEKDIKIFLKNKSRSYLVYEKLLAHKSNCLVAE